MLILLRTLTKVKTMRRIRGVGGLVKKGWLTMSTATMLSSILFTGCAKKGCTDSLADNYCNKCKKDDGSCTYTGKIVWWWNEETLDNMANDDIGFIKFYVNGSEIASEVLSRFWVTAPSCDSDAPHYSTSLGGNKTASINVEIKFINDNLNVVRTISKTYILEGGKCIQEQLTW